MPYFDIVRYRINNLLVELLTEYSLLLLKNCTFDSIYSIPLYQKVINLFVNLFRIQCSLLINSVKILRSQVVCPLIVGLLNQGLASVNLT